MIADAILQSVKFKKSFVFYDIFDSLFDIFLFKFFDDDILEVGGI